MSRRAPSKSVFDSQCGNKWDSSVRLFLHHITCPLYDKNENVMNCHIIHWMYLYRISGNSRNICLIPLTYLRWPKDELCVKDGFQRNSGLVLVGWCVAESGDMDWWSVPGLHFCYTHPQNIGQKKPAWKSVIFVFQHAQLHTLNFLKKMTFDIWNSTNEPMDQWTNGPMVRWPNGPMGQQSNGPVVQWTNGPMDQWIKGPMD